MTFRQQALFPSSGKEITNAVGPLRYCWCFPCLKTDAQSAAGMYFFRNYTTNRIQERKVMSYVPSSEPCGVERERHGSQNWRSVAGRCCDCTADGPAGSMREFIRTGSANSKGGPIRVSRVGHALPDTLHRR